MTYHTSYLPPEIYQTFGFNQEEPGAKLEYSNFEKWVPCFSRPTHACAYCKARHLECWFTYEGQEDCSACKALFRPCSFTAEQHPDVMMETLHTVFEDVLQSDGAMTGSKALRSFDRTPMDHPNSMDDDRSSRRSSTRFSREVVIVLKKWMDQHKDHPYPAEEQKEELAQLTGLTVGQISNWYANHRRRTRQRARGVSPSLRSPTESYSSSEGIPIPSSKRGLVFEGKTWEIMNPMDRWRASPPENEPANVLDIVQAVAVTGVSTPRSSLSRKNSHNNMLSSASSGHRAPSVTSLETALTESQLSSGSFSNKSHASSLSLGSRGSGLRKDRKRRRRTAAVNTTQSQVQNRPFQCTFCTDSFRTKHDWMRHEKSLHLNLEKWICMPLGPKITCTTTGQMMCAFCGEYNPTTEHLESHNCDSCQEKSISERTFYRKDHLRQHLRLVHGCKMTDTMNSWKSEATYINSRCGFCAEEFTSWSERCDHLSKHFRAGDQMSLWKGCRGLDVEVARLVTNAMPPYIIGTESKTPNPFSATKSSYTGYPHPNNPSLSPTETEPRMLPGPLSMEGWGPAAAAGTPMYSDCAIANPDLLFGLDAMGTNQQNATETRLSNCWQILTQGLGQFVQGKLRQGIVPSDHMLQEHARILLYGSDDGWNQTAADNPEWLEMFKKAHGMSSTSTTENIDFMEDLGMAIEDLSFDALLLDSSWDALI
jgi:hypothetical protein